MNNNQNYRFERKFLITDLNLKEIENIIKLHPAIFIEQYQPRFINNIYFDSIELNNYWDNENGVSDRVKVRIRWYGKNHKEVKNPVLEFKVKQGLLGKKEQFELQPYFLDKFMLNEKFHDLFHSTKLPPLVDKKLIGLKAILRNKYFRQYYCSINRNFRITIDSKMEYFGSDHRSNNNLSHYADWENVVLELKYFSSTQLDSFAESISNHFPFRVSKHSKYVRGIEYLYGY